MSYDLKSDGYHAISPDPIKIGGHIANHSCHPNADVKEKYRDALMMRATRPIKAGEEITNRLWFGTNERQSLVCVVPIRALGMR